MNFINLSTEVSSGMNQGDKGKTLSLFGETPEALGRKSKQNSALRMIEGGGSLRLFNDNTEKIVNHDRTGVRIGSQSGQLNLPHQKTLTIQTDWNGVPRAFDHDAGVFDGDEHYLPGTSRFDHVQAIQKAYLKSKSKRKAPVPEERWSLRTDSLGRMRVHDSRNGRFVRIDKAGQDHAHHSRQESQDSNTPSGPNALADYYSYKQKHGLLPEISDARATVIADKLIKEPYVGNPHPGQASLAGNDPYRLNQGHDGYQPTPRLRPNT